LREAFARRLAAGGKDGKTQAQLLSQIEWDLEQLRARSDALCERVPQVLAYAKSLPPPQKKNKKSSEDYSGSPVLSEIDRKYGVLLRMKEGSASARISQLKNAARRAEGAAAIGRAGLAEEDGVAREQTLRQIESLVTQCVVRL
jgi:hypothetical protein